MEIYLAHWFTPASFTGLHKTVLFSLVISSVITINITIIVTTTADMRTKLRNNPEILPILSYSLREVLNRILVSDCGALRRRNNT